MPTLREMGRSAPTAAAAEAQEEVLRQGLAAPLSSRLLRVEQILNALEAVIHYNLESPEARLARHAATASTSGAAHRPAAAQPENRPRVWGLCQQHQHTCAPFCRSDA